MASGRDILIIGFILAVIFLFSIATYFLFSKGITIDIGNITQPIQQPFQFPQSPIIVNVPPPIFETTTTIQATTTTAGSTTTMAGTTTTSTITTTTTTTVPPTTTQFVAEGTTGSTCFDGIDNDMDGFTDFADNGCNQIGLADYDGDGLTNKQEYEGVQSAWGVTYKMNWNNADTDGDGYTDSDELYIYNTDPLNPLSYQASCRENDGGNAPTVPGSIWRNGSGYTNDPNQPWLTDLCQSWIDQYRLVEQYCTSATSHTNVIIDCRTINPNYRCIAGASGGYCGTA